MPTNHLFIGLGGTGQWVLTYTKKNLLESNNGLIPDNVGLIAFDLIEKTSKFTQEKKPDGISENHFNDDPRLEQNKELLFLGGRLRNLVQDISSGRFPEYNWFAANDFLRNLPPSMLDFQQGSGSIRQLARLALYNDVRNENSSVILNRIRQELIRLSSFPTNYHQPLTITLVSSMFGGTGSGILIDVALIVKTQLRLLNINGIINGIFLLPNRSAVVESGNKEYLARCYATWRELDRFMTIGIRNKKNSQLNNLSSYTAISEGSRLFDTVYMVDATSKRGTLQKIDRYIADFLTIMQDDNSSDFFQGRLANNGALLSISPKTSFYSSFGVFTIKTSTWVEREIAAHQLAAQVLNTLLDPISSKENYGHSKHANREVEPYLDFQEEAQQFLSSSYQAMGGKEIQNSEFFHLIAQFVRQENNKELFIEKLKGASSSWGFSNYGKVLINSFTDIFRQVQDDISAKKISNIEEEIWSAVKESKVVKSTPQQMYEEQIHEALVFERRFFGPESKGDMGSSGEYVQVLLKAKDFQMERLKSLVSLWTSRTLNGQDRNPMISHGGKIYYAILFFEKLAEDFLSFSRLLEDAIQQMDRSGIETEALQGIRAAQENYYRLKDKKAFYTFWKNFSHPYAEDAEKKYLACLKKYWLLRMQRVLLLVINQTTVEMRDYLNLSRKELSEWIENLKGISKNLENKIASFELISQINKEDSDRIRVISDQRLELEPFVMEMLSQVKWKVNPNNSQLLIECTFEVKDPVIGERQLQKNSENTISKNSSLLISVAKDFIEPTFSNHSAATDIPHAFDPHELSNLLLDNTEPLYRLIPISHGPLSRNDLLCVNNDRDPSKNDFFQNLLKDLQIRSARPSSALLSKLRDPFSLILLRLDDLIPGSDFDTYQACRQAYMDIFYQTGKSKPKSYLFQVFSAEINAIDIESLFPSVLQKPIRPLCPEVVALLEDLRAIKLFFNGILFGVLKVEHEKIFYCPNDVDMMLDLSEGIDHYLIHNDMEIFEIIMKFTNRDYNFLNLTEYEEKILDKQKLFRSSDIRTDYLDNLRAFLKLILTKATEPSASAKWADLLDLTAILLRQSAEQFQWGELSQLTTIVYDEGIRGIDRLREQTLVMNFFERAGFEVQTKIGVQWFSCKTQGDFWKAKFGKQILVYIFKGKVLDHGGVRKIYDQICSQADNNYIVVIVDKAPIDSAWLEIATLRTEGIQIIPIDDSVIKMGQEAQEERIELDKALSRFIGEDLDLYSVRNPIADRLNFFGREALATKIIKQMEQGKPIGVFGLRKIGKSSLLYYLRNQSPFPVAYVDLQKGWDLTEVFERILNSWKQSLRVKQPNIDWETLPLKNQEKPGAEFISRVNDLNRVLTQRNLPSRLGLVIDEIELMMPGQNSENLENYLEFSRTLRGLIQEDSNLSIIIAGVSSALLSVNRFEDHQNPFYQFFDLVYLGPLSREDTIQMIKNIGQQMGLRFQEQAAEFVADISGGHPFFARQLCSLAIQSSQTIRASGVIQIDCLKKAVQDFIQNPDYASNLDIQGLWGELTNVKIWSEIEIPIHENILETLAKEQPYQDNKFFQAAPDLLTCERAMHNLTSRSVVSTVNHMMSIQFDIFRKWIRRYRLHKIDE